VNHIKVNDFFSNKKSTAITGIGFAVEGGTVIITWDLGNRL